MSLLQRSRASTACPEVIRKLRQVLEFGRVLLGHIGPELEAAEQAVIHSRSNYQLAGALLARVREVHHLCSLIYTIVQEVLGLLGHAPNPVRPTQVFRRNVSGVYRVEPTDSDSDVQLESGMS